MRRTDIIAGICVAGLLLPEAVAYAGIAGLPPQRAIFAAIAGCLGYAIAGRSRFAVVSATSSSAVILAAMLATAPGGPSDKAALATIVVAMTGLLFLCASVARLGAMTSFISRPVLHGFAFALAVTIILHQLPILAGVAVAAPDIARYAMALVASAPSWNGASVATGATALAALLALRRMPTVPGALCVLVAGVVASRYLDLAQHGVALVGTIDARLAWPSSPHLGWPTLTRLAQFAVPLVLILFAESWGTIRTLALRHGDTVDADPELAGLGLANIASALAQGMPVGAGFSAGSASETAGGASRITGVIAAIGLALLVLFAMPAIALLPQPVLAAVVIAALTHALDPAPLLRLWRLDRDQYVALGAALGVLALGVLNGMLLAILLSLVALLRRIASPTVARLGRLGEGHDYVDLARHRDAVAPPRVAIWRPTAPLFFANAERMLAYVTIRTRAAPMLHGIVLSLEESYDLDSTALDALIEFDGTMRAAGIPLQLARLHDRAHDVLKAAHANDLDRRSSYSVDDAVVALTAKLPTDKDRP
uniref:SulP family inorganic anion transporter n=1 Tax=uncultured Sphingomonas sp. TaxID=158754 RepID=UPI0035CC4AA1